MDCGVEIKHLNIVHWNCRSISNKLDHLKYLISTHNSVIDIILLNETWLNSSKPFKIPGYKIIRYDSSRPHGGIAIAIKDKYIFKTLSTPSDYNFQNLLISLKAGSITIDILCVYIPPPPNGKFSLQMLNNSFSSISSRNFLIIGDFNAHHTSWGSRFNDRRGNIIEKFADDHNLICLNDGAVTTFANYGQNSNVLDLVFASPAVSANCSFSLHDDLMSSNHFPIFINVLYRDTTQSVNSSQTSNTSNSSTSTSSLSDINFNRIDWSIFSQLCEDSFTSFCLDSDPLQSYNLFIEKLCCVLMTFHRKSKDCHRQKIRKCTVWWNDLCSKTVNQTKLALCSYKKYPTLENYIIYKHLDAKKKRIISEQKALSWANLCNSFNRFTPISLIWNYMRRFKFAKFGGSTRSHFLNNESNAHAYLNKITSTSNDTFSPSLESYFNSVGVESAQWMQNPFEFFEFEASLDKKKNSSPGPDHIPYSVLKNLPKSVKVILLAVYNQLWLNNVIPPSWKIQFVVPILKPNKDSNSIDSYRPISLTSCLGKLFETMLKNRLEWYIENNKLIPDYQFGFRKGKSTYFNLGCLLGDIQNNLRQNKLTLAVFLDIKGAFDNINHEFLIESLHQLGFPGKVLSWIFNFLNGRSVSLKVNNNLYGPRFSHKGTPQGSVLSPLVFILSIINLMKIIPTSIKYSFYADDLVLYLDSFDLADAERTMNACLTYLSNFLNNRLKLEVNVDKSSVMLFSYINSILSPRIIYNNAVIPYKETEIYLGLMLDSELSWGPHIDYICNRAQQRLNILRSLIGVDWGSDPKVLKNLYISLMRSQFDYGCIFYADASERFLRKLTVLQNKALRIITGAMMSSPINSLEVESGIPPLSIRRSYLTEKFCLNLVSHDNVLICRFLQDFTIPNYNLLPLPVCPTISESIAYLNFEFQDTVHWSSIIPCYIYDFHSMLQDIPVHIYRFNSNQEFYEFLDSKRDYVKIYSDGSKTDSRTSFAYYDSNNKYGKVFLCNEYFSIFSAEILAMIFACKYIKFNFVPSNVFKFLILSDSMSALQALQLKCISNSTNYLIYELRQLVYLLKNMNISVEFCWVPGHSGILGNELVDKLARFSENITFVDYKVPRSDLFKYLKDNLIKRWSVSLENSRLLKGKWHAEIVPVPSTKAWFEKSSCPSRNFITSLCRLRIGHCKFPSHLHRLQLINDPSCKYCNFEHCDLQHLFFDCKYFNIQRLLFICLCYDILQTKETPQSVQGFLKLIEVYKPLYDFYVHTFGPL